MMDRALFWERLGLFVFFAVVSLGVWNGGVWAILGIGAGVLAFGAGMWVKPRAFTIDRETLVLVLGLFCVLGVLNPFAAFADVAWKRTLEAVTIVFPLLVLTVPVVKEALTRHVDFGRLALVMGLAMLGLAVELRLGMPIQQALRGDHFKEAFYNRGLSYGLVLAWGIGAGVVAQKGGKAAMLFALCLVPALVLTLSRAAQLGAGVAVFVFLLAQMAPHITRGILQILTVLTMGWPFFVVAIVSKVPSSLAHLPNSWRHRVEIWDYLSFHILQNPWTGWGFGNTSRLAVDSPHAGLYAFAKGPAAHAHNVFVSLWVELGLVGAVLGVAFAFLTLKKIGNMPERLVPYGLAAWSSAFILALCAYDFWTDSFLAMFALVAVLFSALSVREKRAGL